MRRALMILIALTVVVFISTALQAQELLFGGTRQPFKLTRTPGGNLLLAESGTGTNDGKVSLVTLWWRKIVLLDGLPSGISVENTPNGPTVVVDAHRTIYIVMSEGDNLRRGTPPAFAPNPAGPGSPLFSSIIRARFNPVPDAIRTGFQLTAANLADLADGKEITLQNGASEQVTLQVLVDFRDLVSEPIIAVRASNPFDAVLVGSLTAADLQEFGLQGQPLFEANFFARLNPDLPVGRRLEERSRIYVADSGMNTVMEVEVATGRHRTLTRFPPLQNPRFPTLGGPVTDAVPTGIFARDDGSLLVSILSGFPFVTGLGKVYSVNPATGAFTTYIEGLTTPTDVMEHAGATYVLEISSDLLGQTPGRLLRFATPTSAPTVVTGGLIGPTGIAYEPMRNEFIVSETFTGLIKRIKVP